MSDIYVPPELEDAATRVKKGEKPSTTVRTLLEWFESQRRGFWTVARIRRALQEVKLKTSPSFTTTYLDADITFVPIEEVVALSEDERGDPTYRIGRLESANTKPTTVSPNDLLEKAVTLMLRHDFSQLPIMTTPTEVKGVISWESLGTQLALGNTCRMVQEAASTPVEVSIATSIFEAVPLIVSHGYVLVRDISKQIVGIVTAADLSLQFGQLGEPFLLLGEIENHIRILIDGKFTKEQLANACDPQDEDRDVEGIADLTFGEYVRLLENPDHWQRLAMKIDRQIFVEDLHQVREIRNGVMHFDPDGPTPEEMDTLRESVQFLQRLNEFKGR